MIYDFKVLEDEVGEKLAMKKEGNRFQFVLCGQGYEFIPPNYFTVLEMAESSKHSEMTRALLEKCLRKKNGEIETDVFQDCRLSAILGVIAQYLCGIIDINKKKDGVK